MKLEMRRINNGQFVFIAGRQQMQSQVTNGNRRLLRFAVYIGIRDFKPFQYNYNTASLYFNFNAIAYNQGGIFINTKTYRCWVCCNYLRKPHKPSAMHKMCIYTHIF